MKNHQGGVQDFGKGVPLPKKAFTFQKGGGHRAKNHPKYHQKGNSLAKGNL